MCDSTEVVSSSPDLLSAYRMVRTIRSFEDTLADLVNRGQIPGATHEYSGQEAVAVGVCAVLREGDQITSTHRGHGHLLARGASLERVYAELMARQAGLNAGRGGSMHAADLSLGILGANGIVGAGAPIACGAAWAAKQRETGAVVVCFFGDGALNQGVLLESMNLASIWKLPVIFACENNRFAVTLRVEDAVAGDAVERARAFGMHGERVDGMDIDAVTKATGLAVARARGGNGPSFLDFQTYRFNGHNTGEQYLGLDYRTQSEAQAWIERDPLERLGSMIGAEERDQIDKEVAGAIAGAIDWAIQSPHPEVCTASDFMYAESPARRGLT